VILRKYEIAIGCFIGQHLFFYHDESSLFLARPSMGAEKQLVNLETETPLIRVERARACDIHDDPTRA